MVPEKSARGALNWQKDKSTRIVDGRHLEAADDHQTKKAAWAPQPHTERAKP